MRKFFVSYLYNVQAGQVMHGFKTLNVEGSAVDALDSFIEGLAKADKIDRNKIIITAFNQID